MKIKIKIQIGAIDHKSDYYPNKDDILSLTLAQPETIFNYLMGNMHRIPYKLPKIYAMADGSIHLLEWEYDKHVPPTVLENQ